jgi:YbbR domain-containing protein
MSTAAQKDTPREPIRLRVIPPAVLHRTNFVAWLRNGLRQDLGLRIISVLLAITLWVFVNSGQRGSVEFFTVPISYRNLPPHFLIVNPHPESARIQVTGPRTLLSLIEPSHLMIKLDLTGVAVGQASFKIGSDSFNVPRQTMVTSISPSQIVLDIDRIVTRDAPVHVSLEGSVTKGYRVSSVTAAPSTVRLKGPSKDLARIDRVESEPVNVSATTSNISHVVPLISPSERVRLDPAQVTANVTLSQVIGQKEFRGVPIGVRNNDYPVKLDPARINLTLHGPILKLQQIDLSKAVFVDADGILPGSYDVPVQISLPDGIDLVHQSAEKTRLRMYRGKLAAH